MIPNDLKYTKDHEWVKIEDNIVTIGITDFAQNILGDIVHVDITHEIFLNKNDVFGSVEAIKTVNDLFMPLSGKVIEINPFLELNPELINTDPYGDGWIIMIEISNSDEINSLLDHNTYEKLIF